MEKLNKYNLRKRKTNFDQEEILNKVQNKQIKNFSKSQINKQKIEKQYTVRFKQEVSPGPYIFIDNLKDQLNTDESENIWLVKTEPAEYSWDTMVKDGIAIWDGVRNYQARNNLKLMKIDEKVLFYHSIQGKEIVGITKVNKEYFQDPTTDDQKWVSVELKPFIKFENPVTLEQLKNNEKLQTMIIIKNSRLSVMKITDQEYNVILELSK